MFNQTSDTEGATPQGGSSFKKIAGTLGVLLLLGAVGAAGYFYKELDEVKKNPNKVTQDETRALIDKVGKLIVLPSGEQPTIATVTDPEKLKEQTFFAHAKTGDKVLIYTNARKAILYNPGANQIVEVAPVNIGNSNVSGTTTETSTSTETNE